VTNSTGKSNTGLAFVWVWIVDKPSS